MSRWSSCSAGSRFHREAGIVPHTSIDTEAHCTQSGWHGWVYGWKPHLVTTVAGVWIPLAPDLMAANVADNVGALTLLPELPAEVRYVPGDQHDHDPAIDAACAQVARRWSLRAVPPIRIEMTGWGYVGTGTRRARGRLKT